MYVIIFLILVVFNRYSVSSDHHKFNCRDPIGIGGQGRYVHHSNKKFLVIHGAGAGIGNFLIFFPAAYYFAVITGREILIKDESIIGEMCHVINCGFPHYNQYAQSYPAIFSKVQNVRGFKAFDFRHHIDGSIDINDVVVRADGYKYNSGWYAGHNYSEWCISKVTGCKTGDHSCHDRHALQQLIKGPFADKYRGPDHGGHHIAGAPKNLLAGLLNLPHSMAPRIDAGVHMRCQFRHFEYLVGPDDTALWAEYMKEVDAFLHSKEMNAGQQLFKVITDKILDELQTIIQQRRQEQQRRLQALHLIRRELQSTSPGTAEGYNLTAIDTLIEESQYHGDEQDRIYIYLASDNDRVREAFAEYISRLPSNERAHNISVVRVKDSNRVTMHAKNVDYIKQVDGVFQLAMDWYALSLSNVVFAWRRDTNLLSTFAQSSQRASGGIVTVDEEAEQSNLGNSSNSNSYRYSKGFQLSFRNGWARWSEF